MDDDKASRFISSLVKSIQALCNGFVDFSSSIEVIGHIHLNIDRSVKLNYILTEEVSKAPSEGATVFASHSYHSQPPPSVSSKSASDTSNHGHKSRKDKEADPLGLSALPREVPNTSKSDGHSHSLLNRESSNSSHSFSGNVGFSESESSKHENNRSSCQFEESASRRRKMGPLSQRTPSPAAKRSRVSDFGPGARTVVKEAGFEVIEIKEEPEEEPAVFFGASAGMASGQDIQTPDFSNVVMESLDRVDQLEKGGDLASGDAGDVMSGPQQPVFPVMFHPSDGMPSSSAGPVLGPSDSQPVASTSGGVLAPHWQIPSSERVNQTAASSERMNQRAASSERMNRTAAGSERVDRGAASSERVNQGAASSERMNQRAAGSERMNQTAAISDRVNQSAASGDVQDFKLQPNQRHVLRFVPVTGKKARPQRRCIVCKHKGLRRESRFYCPFCPGDPGFCRTDNCFGDYHRYFGHDFDTCHMVKARLRNINSDVEIVTDIA